MKRLLQEGLVIALAGAAFAFMANALSPRGLALNRDYFFLEKAPPATGGLATPSAGAAATNDPAIPAHWRELSARLAAKGLHLADSNQVTHLFHDPRCGQGLVVFVDARKDDEYQAGHIPGAYQLYYYHPEAYAPTVLPVCQVAQQIVVYCNGGDCIDSELAATMLRDWSVSADKLLVYAGGITEWAANRLPVEIGERKSGQMRPAQ